ncbi:LysR family transcriptional regulator [Piscinibacter sakaiensis]|uniref:Transcriptional regulator, LysR family n=1 Tax=Piscinibacter sakaiensis TaxID=1547922 RepID=A0A0K8NVC5_PISS1|nr:LysR family transcriptional regulator [Piscinibacter sakaiensis]GAP33895.1 transcriptional regulator, LysR family [Piscinibacter sakaiensis]
MSDDLQALSLNDLRLLGLLLQERSVTRVAEATGQAQPAVSRKLLRLRELLADPLLVRSGARMVLTERAQGLREPLREILAQVARLEGGTRFDPARAERAFHIVCSDCLPPDFLPGLVRRLSDASPRITAHVRPAEAGFDLARALDEGGVDLVINNDPRPREDLRIGALYTDEVVCLMRRGHPQAQERRLPLARYLRLRHLAPHTGSQPRSGPIDGELAKTGYQRQIVATLPEFNLAPLALLDSDLVFTTARRFAEHHARMLPLVVVPAPAELPPIRFYQLWHERNHASPASRWLREQVAAQAARLAGDGRAAG